MSNTDALYEDVAIENAIKAQFGQSIVISKMIGRALPVSMTAEAFLFLTEKKQLLLYINAQSRLKLGDVQKIVTRMNLVAELFLPPKGQPDYFDEIGRERFREVFPGRSNPTSDDIRYYRTLASYNPALVQILEVKHGEVFQYDTDSHGEWRPSVKFAYRRIRTS